MDRRRRHAQADHILRVPLGTSGGAEHVVDDCLQTWRQAEAATPLVEVHEGQAFIEPDASQDPILRLRDGESRQQILGQ
jgi:hypothetical protein